MSITKKIIFSILGGIFVVFLALATWGFTKAYEKDHSTAAEIVKKNGLVMSAILKGLETSEGNDAILSAEWVYSVARTGNNSLPWLYISSLYAAKGGDRQASIAYYLAGSLSSRVDAERCGNADPQAAVINIENSSGMATAMAKLLLDDPVAFSNDINDNLSKALYIEEHSFKKRQVASWICPDKSPVLDDEAWTQKRKVVIEDFVKHWLKISKNAETLSGAAKQTITDGAK